VGTLRAGHEKPIRSNRRSGADRGAPRGRRKQTEHQAAPNWPLREQARIKQPARAISENSSRRSRAMEELERLVQRGWRQVLWRRSRDNAFRKTPRKCPSPQEHRKRRYPRTTSSGWSQSRPAIWLLTSSLPSLASCLPETHRFALYFFFSAASIFFTYLAASLLKSSRQPLQHSFTSRPL